MAELAGTIITAASLAADGVKLAKTIRVLIKEIRGSGAEAQATMKELELTVNILEQFKENMESERSLQLQFHARFFEQFNNVTETCDEIFKALRQALDKAIPGILDATDAETFVVRKRDSLRWPFSKIDITSAKKRLEEVKRELQLIVLVVMQIRLVENEKRSREDTRKARAQARLNAKRARRKEKDLLELNSYKIKALEIQSRIAKESLDDSDDVNTVVDDDVTWQAPAKKHNPLPNSARPVARSPRNSGRRETSTKDQLEPENQPGATTNALTTLNDRRPSHPPPTEDIDRSDAQSDKADSAGVGSAMVPNRSAGSDDEDEEIKSRTSSKAAGPNASTLPQAPPDTGQVTDGSAANTARPALMTENQAENNSAVAPRPRRKFRFWNNKREPPLPVGGGHVQQVKPNPNHIYKAFIICQDLDGEWCTWDLPVSAEELINIVDDFNKKRKVVLDHCIRIAADQLRMIGKCARLAEGSTGCDRSAWSLVALKILPKRARGLDVRSIRVVIRADPQLSKPKARSDVRERKQKTRDQARDPLPLNELEKANVNEIFDSTSDKSKLTRNNLERQQESIAKPDKQRTRPLFGFAATEPRRTRQRSTSNPELPPLATHNRTDESRSRQRKALPQPHPPTVTPLSSRSSSAGAVRVTVPTRPPQRTRSGDPHTEHVEVIDPVPNSTPVEPKKKVWGQVRKGKSSGGLFKQSLQPFNTTIVRRRERSSRTRHSGAFIYDNDLQPRGMPEYGAFYPPYSPTMFQPPFMYPPFASPQQYQAMNYAWQQSARPVASARAPSIAVHYDDARSEAEDSVESAEEQTAPERQAEPVQQYASNKPPIVERKTSRLAAKQRDRDLDSLLSGFSGRTSPGPPKVDRDVAKLLRSYANVDVVSQAAESDDNEEDVDADDERGRAARRTSVEDEREADQR